MTTLRQRGAFTAAAFAFALITSELLASPVMLDCKRAPDYAFLAWEKSFSVESSGLRLRAGKGSGGGGFNVDLDVSEFSGWTPALQLTVNPGNQADRLRLILGDADGTSREYAFPPPCYPWADARYAVVHSSIVPCNENLLRALRGEGTAETTGEDNLRAVKLVFAAYESAASGKVVQIR